MIYQTVSIILIVLCAAAIARFSQNKNALIFFMLIAAAMACGFVSGLNLPDLVNIIKRGLAESIAGIGLIIITGHLYAMLLNRTGVFEALAAFVTGIGRAKNSSLALAAAGGIISIPATCETGFTMFSPLSVAVAQKSGIAPAVTALSLSCGMYITHALVLPTPGPLAAAGIMNANMLLLFTLGIAVSIPGIFAADYFSRRYAVKYELEPLAGEEVAAGPAVAPVKTGVALLFASLPLILILIRGLASLPVHPIGHGALHRFICFTGEPFIAILISAGVIIIYAKIKSISLNAADIASESLKQSIQILLVAAAASAFTSVFSTSSIMKIIPVSMPQRMGLLIPFTAAALFKLIHGNSSVAMISGASVAFASIYSMRISPELAVLAAGAGAMVVSHANDPYFWIVSRLSGMSTGTAYRLFTLTTLVCGLVTFLTVFLLGLIL